MLQEPADEFLGKIIFYTTSMGGIRSTVDECRFVKKLFDNLNVEIDERDIFIHKEHQVELDRRLQEEKAPVPQVFVNGICLGGSKELLHLNETGELKELLSGFKVRNKDYVCARCGGFRFINCSSCNGSKRTRRMRISREINMLKCTKCNENGLLKCPDCAPEPVIII
ncbi:predicted protein [Nematostella vectensis]|uniref:Glutaredoxin domain-containing protein n=1 Tax=Nematostella vectensis TaxID=45351 RepID=A7RFF8_NEMVE|nr:predicted protein [Nematostella vectensis]|eukprot:XP_001641662.1 predicted protein [Nematostella vectensis]